MFTKTRGCKLAALYAALLLLSGLPGPPAAADDRSLIKESESEPYVMILLDITGSMNRVPTGSQPYAAQFQDDPASKMYQAKQAIYNVLGDTDLQNVHFGFAVFPNQDNLRLPNKSCSGACISETDSDLDATCPTAPPTSGLEPNYASAIEDDDDLWFGSSTTAYTLKFPSVNNPNDASYPAAMHYGDLVPLDWDSPNDRAVGWNSDNRRLIQRRLAPNLNLDGDGDGIPAWNDANDPQASPDFRVTRYFATSRNSQNLYPLRNQSAIPLIARGNTPLARSLRDFNQWFALWEPLAEANDPKFGCKKVYVIMITDGLDTCEADNGNRETEPPAAAGEVFDGGDGPQVWAVGYSISGDGKTVINNIAQQGGTNACPVVQNCNPSDPTCCPAAANPDHAFFPATQAELADAIADILDSIRGDARSFAAAAVPQGQANVSDKIYLASFFPHEDLALWPGALDAYLRPLPLRTITVPLPGGGTEDRSVPDRGVLCQSGDESACRLWDAADELLLQGPTDTEIAARDYNVGPAADERRVFYSVPQATPTAVPAVRQPFLPETLDDADAVKLMNLMGCTSFPDTSPQPCAATTANLDKLHSVAAWVHETKQYVVPAPDPDPSDAFGSGSLKPYLLGEIFHSDPVVIGSPENFRYYVDDLFADRDTKRLLADGYQAACTDNAENRGYVCFFERHRYRRKLVVAGSNDGQLHLFDGGTFDGEVDDVTGLVTGDFNDGTGREIFSFIPRKLMPMLVDQSQGAIERYGVDGKMQAADVFIDVGAGREWRTVIVGGLREGGAGYFALDVTQPDELPNLAQDDNIPVPLSGSYVPSCLDGGTDCDGRYPEVLWEFDDPDLAEAWSRPALGVVEICSGATDPCPADDVQPRFVAVFGGGIEPAQLTGNTFDATQLTLGNRLFIVDIETGQAIYERTLDGAVPSEPAAVDTDQNGVLDTIYVGTTSGSMYKVDLTGAPPLTAGRVAVGDWDPFPIFEVNTGGDDNTAIRPLFYPPSVIFLADRGRYALAFGTGYREDLWRTVNQNARFVLLLDEHRDTSVTPVVVRPFAQADYLAGILPLDVDDLTQADPESTTLSTANLLAGTGRGWWMELQPEERVIATPFALSGLLVFLTFQPDEVISGGGVFCANAGIGRSFTVQTLNGTTLRANTKSYTLIPDLPTSPFTEVGVTKNPSPTGGNEIEGIPDELLSTMEALKRLFPKECRFGNYTINVKARRSDTGIQWIAPVPICIVQKNWKGL